MCEYTLMLKVSDHAVKGVKVSMLPWIHSTCRVHHRSSHEYLRERREWAKPWSRPPDRLDWFSCSKRLSVLVS
jgi:hypothetical protein